MKNLYMSLELLQTLSHLVPVLPLQQGPAASSQRPSASTNSEDEYTDDDDENGDGESGPEIQSPRSHDSGRTVLYPDLYALVNDEHWTVTLETHKYGAAAGSFCWISAT